MLGVLVSSAVLGNCLGLTFILLCIKKDTKPKVKTVAENDSKYGTLFDINSQYVLGAPDKRQEVEADTPQPPANQNQPEPQITKQPECKTADVVVSPPQTQADKSQADGANTPIQPKQTNAEQPE